MKKNIFKRYNKIVKKLSITISDKTYRDFVQGFKGNKSNLIEDNFLVGIETKTSELSNFKMKIIQLQTDIRNLQDTINKQERIINTYKTKFNTKDQRAQVKLQEEEKQKKIKKKIAFLRAVRNAGL